MAGEVISPLSIYYKQSPNNYGFRNHPIDMITIHCMAGNGSIEGCGEWFARSSTAACSNYGIGSDGRIGCYCEERIAGWTSSSSANDLRAITIEVANIAGYPDWPVSDKAYAALIDLLVDICRRNPRLDRLRWRADPNLFGNVALQNMSAHRWFARDGRVCPGDYLYSRFGDIANKVNARLDKLEEEDWITSMTPEKFENCIKENITPNGAAMILKAARSINQDNDSAEWSAEARKWAVSSGLIQGAGTLADGSPNYMWEDMLTREQMAMLFYRFAKMMGKA